MFEEKQENTLVHSPASESAWREQVSNILSANENIHNGDKHL